MRQRREARAEVVQGETNSDGAEVFQRLDRRGRHDAALGEIDIQFPGIDSPGGQQLPGHGRQIRVQQVSPGEVHRNADVETRFQPKPALAQGPAEHPAGERLDELGLLRRGDELIRRQEAPLRVPPPHERLHSDCLADPEINLGLEVEDQLVVPDGVSQFSRQLEPGGVVVILPGSVHRVSAPGALGDVHRHIGVAQQGQRVLAVVRTQRDADARARMNAPIDNREGPLQRREDFLGGHRPALAACLPAKQDRKFISAEACHRVRAPEKTLEAARHLLQQLVADVVPESVVHLLEAVHVHDQQGDRFPLPLRRQDGLAQPIVQQGPVRQTREDIVQGPILERLPLDQLIGDVPQYADETPFAAQEHFGGAGLNRERGPVLAAAPHLARSRGRSRIPSRPHMAGEEARELPLIGLRHEQLGLAAQDLVRRVAEQPLGGPVERFDEAAFIGHHDTVGDIVEHRVDVLHALLQRLLGALPLDHLADLPSDVGHHSEEAAIRLAGVQAEQGDDAGHGPPVEDRKRDGGAPTALGRRGKTTEGGFTGQVGDPDGLPGRPDMSRQPDPGQACRPGRRFPLDGLRGWRRPGVQKTQDFKANVHDPDLPSRPASGPAEVLENLARHLVCRRSFRQRTDDRER